MMREMPHGGAGRAGGDAVGARRPEGVGDRGEGVGAQALGEGGGVRGAQGREGPVHLVLAAGLARHGAELGVAHEPVAQRGEREGLQDVLDDAERDALADDGQVACRGHGDDVGGVPGGPQGAQQAQAVAVGEVEVEQEELDGGSGRGTSWRRPPSGPRPRW
ncbi:hypothetical protein GCM10020221_00020 [Streptomyces thioluteus]|uniref:Uncharacterized protein n=1 Tax=Streptomyces thioluteus TaxID=66431 RepID=A0ABN3WC14_STRTU